MLVSLSPPPPHVPAKGISRQPAWKMEKLTTAIATNFFKNL